MAEVWVTGVGLCSALGSTLHQSWSALMSGQSGIIPRQPFERSFPLALLGKQPASLNHLIDLALADLTDGGVLASGLVPGDLCDLVQGVVLGSSRGYQSELEQESAQWRQSGVSHNWERLYVQSPAAYLAQKLVTSGFAKTISGPVLAPRAACSTGLWAIAQGFELIQAGQCDAVIAGGAEAPVTPLTLAGFQRMGALAPEGAYPFDQRRQGFVLGEGAALLLLERRETALSRGVRPYGRILGFGLTNDGHYAYAPSENQVAAVAAVRDCLTRSQIQSEVDYIHAHGTATALNDAAEAKLIQSIFKNRPAVSSTKGATGHTLGASGALGAAFCLMALRHQRLPPCTGLAEPAYDLNWVRPPACQDQPASWQRIRTALCLSFGFGGQNAAMAFSSL
jgi:3-oxoacyl-[acyl-carrier-protein] synthase II